MCSELGNIYIAKRVFAAREVGTKRRGSSRVTCRAETRVVIEKQEYIWVDVTQRIELRFLRRIEETTRRNEISSKSLSFPQRFS